MLNFDFFFFKVSISIQYWVTALYFSNTNPSYYCVWDFCLKAFTNSNIKHSENNQFEVNGSQYLL